MANKKWNKIPLKKLCSRIGDGLHGTPEYVFDSEIYFINGNNLKNGRIEITSDTKRVTASELSKNFIPLNENSLLLSINGTLGSMAFYNGENVMLGKSAAYLNFNSNINQFYYYYFQLKGVQEYFYNVATGSTIKNLSLKSIQDFEVPVPEESDRNGIVRILKSLDAKIELNNKINRELEAMAKTLYDYWFVQFDFPNANGKPYKSSGGKMVYNAELKREIPERWEAGTLNDAISKTGTGLNPRDNFVLGEGDNYYVTIKSIEQGRVVLDDKCDKISDETLEIINKRSDLQIGDILFTSIEPVGLTYLIQEIPKNWNINESVFTIRPNYKKVTSEFLFMFLSGDYIKAYTKNVAAGSIHKGVRHSTLKECKFIIPAKNTIMDFTQLIKPILKKLDLLQKQNQHLTALRDWLLPMLMNGQVTVKQAEERLSMAAEPSVKYGN